MTDTHPQRSRALRAVAGATLASTLAVSPGILLGGLGVLVRADLGFDEAQLGQAVGTFFLFGALAAMPGGRIADRLGARTSLLLAGTGTAAALVSIALLVQSWPLLVAMLALAGLANGLGQTSTHLALVRAVPHRRQGFAFGIKQSAIPLAGLIAGAALPLVGLTVGWRWAFAGCALGVVLVALALPRGLDPERPNRRTAAPAPPLAITAPLAGIAAGALLAVASATSLGIFLVESSVARGVGSALAGVVLALGSLSSILTRCVGGWLADRAQRDQLSDIARLLGIGVGGFLLLAVASHPGLVLLGGVVGFAAGWGWPGLIFFGVVRLHPETPAAAAGFVQSAMAAGAVVGPIGFGFVASRVSFGTAWVLAGLALLAAALLIRTSAGTVARRHGVTVSRRASGS